MSKLTHHFASLREVKMHYVTAGEGDTTLVLLHGYPQSWYCWRDVISELQPVADHPMVKHEPELHRWGERQRVWFGLARISG